MRWDYMRRGTSGDEMDNYYFDEFTYTATGTTLNVAANSMVAFFSEKPFVYSNTLMNYSFAQYSQSLSVSIPAGCYYCVMPQRTSANSSMVYFCDEDGNQLTAVQETATVGAQYLLLALYPAALVAPAVDPYADQLMG